MLWFRTELTREKCAWGVEADSAA